MLGNKMIMGPIRKIAPSFVKKPLKRIYNEASSRYNFNKYGDLYKYKTIYIAAGNRTASTWLRDVLAELLDGYSNYHPRSHPKAEKGGNYDIYDRLIDETKNRLFVIRSHTPAKPSNIEMMNKHFGMYLATVRDIRDVVVSLSFNIQKRPKNAFMDFGVSRILPWNTLSAQEVSSDRKTMIDIIIDKILPGVLAISESWVDYAKENDNVLLIKYEDMTQFPLMELKKILGFFNLQKSDSEIESVMNALNPMRKAVKRADFAMGRIGIWKQYLTVSQQKKCEGIGENFLKKMGYDQ
jgi:hypothetical protein